MKSNRHLLTSHYKSYKVKGIAYAMTSPDLKMPLLLD